MKIKKIVILVFVFVFLGFCMISCENKSRIEGVKEKGKLEKEPEIAVKIDGETQKMKLEEYIAAVVAGEMHKNWPQNAYGAQAILARSYALKHMEEEQTDTISGNFAEAQEFKPSAVTDKIRKAVEKTRGEVALYQEEYIRAWYHSSAGGETTSAKVGLGYKEKEPGYIKSVKSPDDKAPDDIKKWNVEFSNNKLSAALEKMGKNIGEIETLRITNKDKTGRAINFTFQGSAGTAEVLAAEYRNLLDPKKLKSTKISSIEKKNEGVSFSGSGFGHGVGLSQWGAYAMSKNNKSPEDIVEYYFKDIEIVKVYE